MSINLAKGSTLINSSGGGFPGSFTTLVATGASTFSGAQNVAVRVVTAAGAVTVGATDFIVVVNKTVGAATIANLPASPAVGRVLFIKDGKGDATTNNITVTPAAGTIDGTATFLIATNYNSVMLVYNGTEWNKI
jgi:P pilus assembly chaperone PapD